MKRSAWLGLGVMGIMVPVAASAQNTPALSAEEIANMLSPGAASSVAYSADDLAAILAPAKSSTGGATRSLKGGGDEPAAAPGQPSSGVVPDLRINFASGSARLNPASRAQLDELGRALQLPQLSSLSFIIAGHTDAAGSDEMNRSLSEKRAQSVVEYLIESYSIEPDRLEAEGYGESKLLDTAKPNSGVNRRVEVMRLQ